MAGNAKPNTNMIEAKYSVIDGYPKASTNNVTGLFDGNISTGAKLYGGLTYREIGWTEIKTYDWTVLHRYIYCSTNGSGTSANIQILKKDSNDEYVDVTDKYLVISDGNNTWTTFTSKMPPGIYKFVGKTITGSYDPEWFIEKVIPDVNFLIADNDIYKTYDAENNCLIPFTDSIDELLNDKTESNVIRDLTPVLPLLKPGMVIFSNKQFRLMDTAIKTNKQLLIANGDFSTKLAANIDWFKFNFAIPENCFIKAVISTNSGISWKTYLDGQWVELSVNCPLKSYNELTSDEIAEWDTFLNEILDKGIDIGDIETVDFNTLDCEKLRFGYGIQIERADSEAILQNLKWQFDSFGSYCQLAPKTEIEISQTNNAIKIKPLKDVELMKINIGISSDEPTSGSNINYESDENTQKFIDTLK